MVQSGAPGASRIAAAGDVCLVATTTRVYKDARIIFTDTEKSNWTWDETAKAYYWHRFFSHQPDLNFDNPMVIEEVLKAMRFWLDMGVDALRMDAIPYLCERDGTSCENLPETHAVIKAIRAAIDADYANRLVLAEANQWPADVRPYFGDGDECHMAFHFPLMPRIYMALRQEDRLPITDIMAQTPPIPDNCQWGLFLRNHDELTLEMVTDDERDYMYFAYSADPRMRINVGIRRRLAPLVDNNRRRIELLNSTAAQLSRDAHPLLRRRDRDGRQHLSRRPQRRSHADAVDFGSQRGVFEVRSGAALFSRRHGSDLWIPGGQRRGAAQRSIEPAALDPQHDRAAQAVPGVRARDAYLPESAQPQDSCLPPRLGSRRWNARDDLVRGKPQPVRTARALDLAPFAGMEPVEMLGYVSFPTITEAPYSLSLASVLFHLARTAAGRRRG